jgi:chromosome segregation ATPase
LQQSEILHQQIADDNQRLQREISSWQERLADSEEQRRQLTTLQHHFDALRTKRAAVSESYRRLEEELDALARSVEMSESSRDTASPVIDLAADSACMTQEHLPLDFNPNAANLRLPFGSSATSAAPEAANANTHGVKKRRFGIFPAMLALTLGGVASGFLR